TRACRLETDYLRPECWEVYCPEWNNGATLGRGCEMESDFRKSRWFCCRPCVMVLDEESQWEEIVYPYFDQSGNGTFIRSIPVKEVQLADGSTRKIATIYDVMLSQYGVKRPGATHIAENYLDENSIYTPGWQRAITSVKPELVIQIAREFAE